MAVRGELKSILLLIIGAVLGVGLYVSCIAPTSDTSASHSGFLEVDGPPVDGSLLGGAMDGTSTRRLGDVNDVPFIQNATNTRCAKGGDRLFTKSKTDLPGCYAECSNTPRCNYFAIAFTGPVKGWCSGCEIGVSDYRDKMIFFTMVRNKETTFSCPEGLVTSLDLDALVDGGKNYRVCGTKEGDEDPTCTDLRNASITFCAPSSSTSTSTMTTSGSTTSSSTSTSTAYTFVPQNPRELQLAVRDWIQDKPAAQEQYGDISRWDTSLINDMSSLFAISQDTYFNDDIGNWDVSQVTAMRGMFYGVRGFKQDLSAWNVSSVKSMYYMFHSASDCDLVLSGWDVSNVEDMSYMFYAVSSFHADLSGWNTMNVLRMRYMVSRAMDFSLQDISAWNTSKVQEMSSMFKESSFNQDISSWDVSSVQLMDGMFQGSPFNQDLALWDVSSVKHMYGMFRDAVAFNGSISTWNVARVESMSYMFQNAKVFNRDISAWNVKSVTFMHRMFNGADDFLDVDVSVWKPSSLLGRPTRFISSASIACTQGNWSHWPYEPECF